LHKTLGAGPSESIDYLQRQRFVLWMGLPIMLGFTLLGAVKHIYPAWPAPGFWVMTLLLGDRAARWSPRGVRRWLRSSGVVIAALLLFAWFHVVFGSLQKPGGLFGGVLPPQQDPVNQLFDTRQLQQRIAAAPQLRQALAEADVVFTDEVFLAGYLAMALRSLTPAPVTCLSQDPRGFAIWHDPAQWLGKTGIYITLADADPAPLAAYFERFAPLGQVSTQRSGAISATFSLYTAEQMTRPYEYPY
jgi:hypothetical protein